MRRDNTSSTAPGTFPSAERKAAREARVFCSAGTRPEVRLAITEHLLTHPLPAIATGTLTYTPGPGDGLNHEDAR